MSDHPTTLRIDLLGGLRISAAGETLPLPESRRARLLLAWLALNPGHHSRSRVAAVLRPEGYDEEARRTLRQSSWYVNRALSEHGRGVLLPTRTDIGLDAARIAVDVVELREQARAGDAAAARTLRERPLLPEHDADWVVEVRDALRHEATEIAAGNAAAAERAGDLESAITWARERAVGDQLSEVAQRELMRLLAAAGDRAAAVEVASDLRRRLDEELGLIPSYATRTAIEELLTDDGAGTAPAAPVATALQSPPLLKLVSGPADAAMIRAAAEAAAEAVERGATVLFGWSLLNEAA